VGVRKTALFAATRLAVFAQKPPPLSSKPGGRLVQEDEWRVVKERAGDREFLLHARLQVPTRSRRRSHKSRWGAVLDADPGVRAQHG